VGAPPAALEERHILVELVVLVGVVLCKRTSVGRGGRVLRQLQTERQGIAYTGRWRGLRRRQTPQGHVRVITLTQAIGVPHNVRGVPLPAKIMIVLKEVPEAGGGDDLLGQADVSAKVIGRVRGRPTDAMGKTGYGSVDTGV